MGRRWKVEIKTTDEHATEEGELGRRKQTKV